MKKPEAKVVKKVPWYRRKRFVQVSGAIVGFLVMAWVSIFIVFHTTRLSQIPIDSSNTQAQIDKQAFASQFHAVFDPTTAVDVFYWPPDASFMDWLSNRAEPAVVSVSNLADWNKIYKWISGFEWLAQNTGDYDFQAQNSPIFKNVDMTKPLATSTPIPAANGESIQATKLENFFRVDFGETADVEGAPKFKRFQGFLWEFEGAPRNEHYQAELKDQSVKAILMSKGAKALSSMSLSGRLYMQGSGTSDWLVSSPSEVNRFNPYPFLHPLSLQSQLDTETLILPDISTMDFSQLSIDDTVLLANSAGSIEAQYVSLLPGQLLYVPALWNAQFVTKSTSVIAMVELNDGKVLETRLKEISQNGPFKQVGENIELLWKESHKNAHGEGEKEGENPTDINPELLIREKILSLVRILHGSFFGSQTYSDVFTSYEAYHSHIVATKSDLIHKVVSKACDTPEMTTTGEHFNFDEKVRQALAPEEQRIIKEVRDALEIAKDSTDRPIVQRLFAEAIMYAALQDGSVIHNFLHDCSVLWKH